MSSFAQTHQAITQYATAAICVVHTQATHHRTHLKAACKSCTLATSKLTKLLGAQA